MQFPQPKFQQQGNPLSSSSHFRISQYYDPFSHKIRHLAYSSCQFYIIYKKPLILQELKLQLIYNDHIVLPGQYKYLMAFYRFPTKIAHFLQITSMQDIDDKLSKQFKKCGLANDPRHLMRNPPRCGFIRFHCNISECKWKIIFKENQNLKGFRLWKLVHYHFHLNYPLYKDPYSFSQNTKDLEGLIIFEQKIYQQLKSRFGITSKQYIKYSSYINDKSYNLSSALGTFQLKETNRFQKKQSSMAILKNLFSVLKKQLILNCIPEIQRVTIIPEFVFLSRKNCHTIYEQKGMICALAVLEDRIVENFDSGENMFCAIFYGILSNNQCVPYATAVYPQRTLKTELGKIVPGLFQAISLFFSHFGACQTFITEADQDTVNTVKYCLSKKFPSIFHLIDPYDYVYKNFPEDLYAAALKIILSQNNEDYSKNSLKWFQDSNYSEYERKVMSECLHAYEQFYQTKSLYSSYRPFLIAHLLQTNINTIIVQILRHKFHKKQTLGRFLQTFIKASRRIDQMYEKLISQMKYSSFLRKSHGGKIHALAYPFKVQIYLHEDPSFIEEIKNLRVRYYKEGFMNFMEQLSRTPETDIVKISHEQLEDGLPVEIIFRDNDKKIFSCSLEEGRYSCSCYYTAFWGIPCKHLCKLQSFWSIKIQQYFSRYWRMSLTYQDMRTQFWGKQGRLPPKLGKPRKTHRNTL